MQWKTCFGYPEYEISEYGDMRRLTASKGYPVGHIKRAIKHTGGYLQHCVNKHKKELVHRLVALTFIGLHQAQSTKLRTMMAPGQTIITAICGGQRRAKTKWIVAFTAHMYVRACPPMWSAI